MSNEDLNSLRDKSKIDNNTINIIIDKPLILEQYMTRKKLDILPQLLKLENLYLVLNNRIEARNKNYLKLSYLHITQNIFINDVGNGNVALVYNHTCNFYQKVQDFKV